MNVLVKDTGFTNEDWAHGFTNDPAELSGDHGAGLDLASDIDPNTIPAHFANLGMIRIHFASFADGRGFTIARRLRLMGYAGRLRAYGHVISDQYAMARRSGFDEVEINADLAARQPEKDWIFRADWTENDYQSRLRAAAV